MSIEPEGLRHAGDCLYFEYHCLESHDSGDAQLWYRSHQQVTVLAVADNDGMGIPTFNERLECGQLICYDVRFDDGFEGTAMEDELLNSEAEYERPDPPSRCVKVFCPRAWQARVDKAKADQAAEVARVKALADAGLVKPLPRS